jgi:ribosomal protein L6P/L9E
MRGLGYRVKHITTDVIRFFIGTTNFYYFIAPYSVIVRVRRRKLLLIGFDKSLLIVIFLSFFCLKKIIPYKLRGFFFPRQVVLMKPGKKRF